MTSKRRDRKRPRVSVAPPPAPEASRASGAGGLFAALAAVALALVPVLSGQFVAIDDREHIAGNPHFRSGPPFAFVAFWKQAYFGLYVPLTYTIWSFAALVSRAFTATLHPAVFHALGLGVHLLNVVLVHRLLLRIAPAQSSPWASVLGAALFGLHPIQVESVAWASELRGLLALGFALGALLVRLGERESIGVLASHVRRAWLASALFACALLCKPTAVALPVVLLAIECLALGKRLGPVWPLPAAWTALGLGLTAITKSLQPDVNLEHVPGWLERPLIALDALGFYLGKALWPFGLGMDYGRTPAVVLSSAVYLATGALALFALAVIVVLGRKHRGLACAGALFVAPLLPVLGLVPFEFQDISSVADRYAYGSLLGVAHAGMLAYRALASRFGGAARLGTLVLLATLGVASHLQARTWHDSPALFTRALAVNPQSFGAHHGLASHFYWQGHFTLARDHCERALAVKPGYLPAQKGLADALRALGDHAGALRQYRAAIEAHPSARGKQRDLLAEVHADLAVALYQQGDAAAAIEQLRNAVALRRDLDVAHRNLGRLLLQRGERADAIAHFRAALQANPFDELSKRELQRAAMP